VNRAQAQELNRVDANARVFARVVSDFSAVETSEMTFEDFSTQSVDGVSILNPQNNHSNEGSIETSCRINYAANFYVSRDRDTDFSISLPRSPIALRNISENKAIFVSDWKSVFLEKSGSELTDNGFRKVYIGATVEVGPYFKKPGGLYTGIYIVTFDFN
jgi:hypothetical protein